MIEKSHTAKQGFGKSGADVFQMLHLRQALTIMPLLVFFHQQYEIL